MPVSRASINAGAISGEFCVESIKPMTLPVFVHTIDLETGTRCHDSIPAPMPRVPPRGAAGGVVDDPGRRVAAR